jgi:adenylate kinase
MEKLNLRNLKTDDLFSELKRRFLCTAKPKFNALLIGAPGSGKGTQAVRMKEEYCLW